MSTTSPPMPSNRTLRSEWAEVACAPVEIEEVAIIRGDWMVEALSDHVGHEMTVEGYGARLVCTECAEVVVDL